MLTTQSIGILSEVKKPYRCEYKKCYLNNLGWKVNIGRRRKFEALRSEYGEYANYHWIKHVELGKNVKKKNHLII